MRKYLIVSKHTEVEIDITHMTEQQIQDLRAQGRTLQIEEHTLFPELEEDN